MVCATELLHAANFCPVCGARLAAPPPDGSAATTPGGEPPPPVVLDVPAPTQEPNVVYLPGAEHGGTPVAPNPHAGEYNSTHAVPDPYTPPAGGVPPTAVPPPQDPVPMIHPAAGQPPQQPPHAVPQPEPTQPAPGSYAAEVAASIRQELGAGPLHVVAPAIATSGSHGAVPTPEQLVPPQTIETNPFGDFFSDGPSAWLEDDADDESVDEVPITAPRVAGTTIALAAIGMLIAAWVVWGMGVYRGAGGAEAAPTLFVSMVLWIWYLSLPRVQQHAWLLGKHRSVVRLVDRRSSRLRTRTEGSLLMRRERDRYRAMRDERERRILALGEASQRLFRTGQLPADLQGPAQRVLAIERQMLAQDTRIHQLVTQRQQAEEPPRSSYSDPDA